MDRPWLDSRAREVARETLSSSPVTGPKPLTADAPWSINGFDIDEARATTVRFGGSGNSRKPTVLDARAYLDLSGRSLSLLIALRWPRVKDRPSPLPLDVFYWALLTSLVSLYSTCWYVARAMDAAEPSDIRPSEAWLTSDTRQAIDAVDISEFDRDGLGMPEGANFPSARPPTTELDDLDELGRDWLTYWLLDIGTYGFEERLAGLEIPAWIRPPVPEL